MGDWQDEEISVPNSKLLQEVGWLSPEGKYYPCEYDDPMRNTFFHLRKAREIVHHFYPDQVGYDDYGPDGGPQAFLARLGWIRLDINDMWVWHRPTQAQVDTLFDLYKLKPQRYLPTEKIRLCLAWRGLKFLSKAGDDYLDFEAYLPTEEQNMDFPKLETPGRRSTNKTNDGENEEK